MTMRSNVNWATGAAAAVIVLAAGCGENGGAVEEARDSGSQDQVVEETAAEEPATAEGPNIAPASAEAPEEASVKQLNLKVAGMGCGGCEVSIEDALAKIPGVAACKASFEKGTTTVEMGDEPANRDEIVAAIEELGFDVLEGDPEAPEKPQT